MLRQRLGLRLLIHAELSRSTFPFCLLFFFLRFYLFIHERQRERERERERQAEGEAGFMQGTQRGTPSQISRIRPWAEGGAKPLSHPGYPQIIVFESETVAICSQLCLISNTVKLSNMILVKVS